MSDVYTHADFAVVGIMKSENASDTYAGATVFYQQTGESQITYLTSNTIVEADVDHQARFEANVVPHIQQAITDYANFTTSNSEISVDSYTVQGVKL